MSWWVYLEDHEVEHYCDYGSGVEGACCSPCYPAVTVERFEGGGTRVMDGSDIAELNVTYNYDAAFHHHLHEEEGLRWLHGKSGAEALPRLISAVEGLGTNIAEDYWASTDGNAGYALSVLASWAKQHPTAVFRVS